MAALLTSVLLSSCGWRSGTPQIQPLFLVDVTGVVIQEGLRQMVEAEVKRGLSERGGWLAGEAGA